MNRTDIQKIAQTAEDKLLLAKVWDKINMGLQKNISANTPFLSPREQALCQYLFGNMTGLISFGGYSDAERKMLIYVPDYLDEDSLYCEDSPICCLRATYFQEDLLTHRDFLGALMGAGVSRDVVGDICVQAGTCDFFVSSQIAPFILQNLTSAGRTKINLDKIPLTSANIPEAETVQICDTLASLRLDSVVSSGFRISRAHATQQILAGKVSIDGLPCEKPDKAVTEGAKISLRGSGKIQLHHINGQTKKGRISVVIRRYI